MKFIRKSPADTDNLESPQKFEAFFLDYYPRIKGFINGLLQNAVKAGFGQRRKISLRIFLHYCGRIGET